MPVRNLVSLLLLSMLWGVSFLFIRIGTLEFGPLLLMFLRVLISAAGLLIFALLQGPLPSARAHWRPLLAVAVFNSAFPYALIATAETNLPASLAAILNATTPLFGELVGFLWWRAPLLPGQLLALLLGVVGVAFLLGLGPLPLNTSTVLAATFSLLAAASFGWAAAFTRHRLPGYPPLGLALYSQLFSVPLLLPCLGLNSALPIVMPSLQAWFALTALALLCTVLALLLYFSLIQRVGVMK